MTRISILSISAIAEDVKELFTQNLEEFQVLNFFIRFARIYLRQLSVIIIVHE